METINQCYEGSKTDYSNYNKYINDVDFIKLKNVIMEHDESVTPDHFDM